MYKYLKLICFFIILSAAALPATVHADEIILDSPVFSHAPGFYPSAFTLNVRVSNANHAIRYTLDGSVPTERSRLYTGSISIESAEPTRTNSPMSTTGIGSSFEHGFWLGRPCNNDGCWAHARCNPNIEFTPQLYYNGMVVRVRAFDTQGNSSETATASYFVERPNGRGRHENIRTVSITIEPGHFADPIQGIYRNWDRNDWPGQTGVSNNNGPRHPANIEMFDESGRLMFSQIANTWVMGNWSRRHPKRSLRFNFSQGGGDIVTEELIPRTRRNYHAPLEYVNTFRHMSLRLSDHSNTGIRDSLIARISEPLRPTVQESTYGAVFVNGEFWGMYDFRTHRNEHLLGEMFGVPRGRIELTDWIGPLTELVRARDMTRIASFAELDEHIDMDDLIDYMIIGYHFENWDWLTNNFEFWRTTEVVPNVYGGDGRWRFIVQDFDNAIFHQSNNFMTFFSSMQGDPRMAMIPDWFGDSFRDANGTDFFRGLFANQEFRNRFAARYSTYTGTVFHSSRTNAVIDDFVSQREGTIGIDLFRWGYHGARSTTDGLPAWRSAISEIRGVLNNRANFSIDHIRRYYNAPRAGSTMNLPSSLTNITWKTDSDRGFFDISGAQIRADLFRGDLSRYSFDIGEFRANYIRGLPITVTAVPNAGYVFSHFIITGGMDRTATQNPAIITPSADNTTAITVEAFFEAVAVAAPPVIEPSGVGKHLVIQIGGNTISDLNGNMETQYMDVSPMIVDGRTLIPLRFLANALEAETDWNEQTREVTLTLDGRTLTIPIGTITRELTALGLDVPAQIIDGRTMVPLRFISEFFDAAVEWDASTRTITIIQG